MSKATLTERDHRNMDAFLGHVLDDYKTGELSRERALSGLAHVMSALAIGNIGEAQAWFAEGRKLIRDGE